MLEHELAARNAPKTSSLKVAWAVPTRDADHILWLMREKLNQTALVAPVIEMKLFTDKVSEHAPPPDMLFPMPGSDSDSMAQLLEHLSARLGAENVVQLVAKDDHRPEAAMVVEPYPHVLGVSRASERRLVAGSCTGFSDEAAMDDLSDIVDMSGNEENAVFSSALLPDYVELHCLSNFSFLRGALHSQELAATALEHGYTVLAIMDECSLAGVVRAHGAIKDIQAKAELAVAEARAYGQTLAEKRNAQADRRQRIAAYRCRRRPHSAR